MVTVILMTDECQNKYGNANAWRYCTRVFDLLTVAAVSIVDWSDTCYRIRGIIGESDIW